MRTEPIYVSHREPTIARILAKVGSNSQKVQVRVDTDHTLFHTYWDSGSRYVYSMLRLDTLDGIKLPSLPPPQFGGPDRDPKVEIPPNAVLVEIRQGNGRPFVTLYVRPENAAPLLPAPCELTREEKIVLAATAELKPSYGGVKDLRFHEAHEQTGIAREPWDAAKSDLIARKLLNAAGAITVDGRNAIGRTRLYDLRAKESHGA